MAETRNAPNTDGEDRISMLHDEIIHHILSLVDTKYAVQTSVLSRRWIDVWKSLPYLNFNRWSFSEDKKDSFEMFVDMVLYFRENIDIWRFHVDWKNSAYDHSVIESVKRWSLAAAEYNVKDFSIAITQCHNSAYEIPHRLLNCKLLEKLVIDLFNTDGLLDIILPRSMDLPKLKVLGLGGLSISNVESSKQLFSSCPVLETLVIQNCAIQTDNGRKLVVDSVNLKKFVYTLWRRRLLPQNDNIANIIKLCAPNLEDFTCGTFLTLDHSLEICSPLSRVWFHMRIKPKEEEDENADAYLKLPSEEKDAYAKRVMKFLRAVYMVKAMRLSPGFLEVLSHVPDLLNYRPPRLCNLQHLLLEMWFTRGCLRAIAYVLKISPNIIQLALVSKETSLTDVGDDWDAGMSSRGMLSNLKYVLIIGVEGCHAELKLLSFLLKTAKVLEKVSLKFRSTTGLPDRERQVKQFWENLRAVPTASTSIIWFRT